MKAKVALLLLALPLSGCMGNYYEQQVELYRMMLADRESGRNAELVSSMQPLVNFKFVDSGGQEQTLTVNQQRTGSFLKQFPVPQLKAPGEQFFPWFDRAVSLGGSLLPWAFIRRCRGDRYSFGNNVSFWQTGSKSPLDWAQVTETTTMAGQQ